MAYAAYDMHETQILVFYFSLEGITIQFIEGAFIDVHSLVLE